MYKQVFVKSWIVEGVSDVFDKWHMVCSKKEAQIVSWVVNTSV